MPVIYKATNKITGLSYIGFTKGTAVDRLTQHVREGHSLHRAITEYGIENFDLEVLEESDDWLYLVSEREAALIKEHNTRAPNGYNLTNGGEYGIVEGIPVFQHSMEGEFIRQYESAAEAARVLGTHRNYIWNACRRARVGKASKSAGYLWSFEKGKTRSHKRNPGPGLAAARKKNTGRKRPEHSEFMRQLNEQKKQSSPVHTWVHKDGRQFTGTRYELSDEYPDSKIIQSELGCVLSGKYKSHKGWSLTNAIGK